MILSAQSIRKFCIFDTNKLDNKQIKHREEHPEFYKQPMLDPFIEETREDLQLHLGDANKLSISHGLGSASYSVRLAQDLFLGCHYIHNNPPEKIEFGLFSTLEKFQMPNNIAATVHDKSTWARRGLAVQTTFIDPGWCGWLTLEISYHGDTYIFIPKGYGIAQIVFHRLDEETELPYKGKYQNQGEAPQKAL